MRPQPKPSSRIGNIQYCCPWDHFFFAAMWVPNPQFMQPNHHEFSSIYKWIFTPGITGIPGITY